MVLLSVPAGGNLLCDPSRRKVWTHHGKSYHHAVKNALLHCDVIAGYFEYFEQNVIEKLFVRSDALHRIPRRPG